MFGAAVTICVSALVILTIPAGMETFAEGARTVVGLQAVALIAASIIRGIWAVWVNRLAIREFFRTLVEVAR